MWKVGAAIGLLVGVASGGVGGAIGGALLGAACGAMFHAFVLAETERRLKELESKFETVSATLTDVYTQLDRLQRKPVQVQSAPASQVFAAAVASAAMRTELPTEMPTEAPTTGNLNEGEKLGSVTAAVAQPGEPADAIPEPVPNFAPARLEAMSAPVEGAATPAFAQMGYVVESTAPADPMPLKVSPPNSDSELAAAASADAPLSFLQRLVGGNIVAKVGVVILFFGVGFLLKFAYDHGVLPPWVRLLSVAAASAAMFFIGLRLLERRRLYALILMGGAMGFLYLDVFFALKTYAYIKPGTGFGLFFLLGVATTLLAVRMDARVLAVLGLTGAFLAPPLASTGGGSHVLLFSYYTLLNAFILGVSWFKAWRDLNLVGFLFTFVISSIWGASNFRPELFASVEPFLLLYFAMYLAIPVLFALRQPPQLKGFVDATLVFGVPLATSFMQARLVEDFGDYALAWSAGVAALIYFMLGFMLVRRETLRTLGEAHLALGTIFATFAIFFAFDAYPTFALWTLEGAAVVWIGLRQSRLLARLFGLVLQIGAAMYFLSHRAGISGANPLFDDFLFGCGLIAIAAWISAHFLHKYRAVLTEDETWIGGVLLFWGFAWWFGGGLDWMDRTVPVRDFGALMLLFALVSLGAAELFGTRWPLGERDEHGRAMQWPELRRVSVVHIGFVVAGMVLLAQAGAPYHPLERLGALAWPLAFAAFFWILHRQRQDQFGHALEFRYGAGWVALFVLATWEAVWQLSEHNYAAALFCALLGFAAAYLRFHLRERGVAQPVQGSRVALLWALAVWGAATLGWMHQQLPHSQHVAGALGVAAVSIFLFEVAGSLLVWPDLRRTQALLPPVMAVALGAALLRSGHALTTAGALAWATALVLQYIVLYRQERDACAVGVRAQHLLGLWMTVILLASELVWRANDAGLVIMWQRAAWGAAPALAILLVVRLADGSGWPCGKQRELYLLAGVLPLLLAGLAWSFYANLAAPGPAVPAIHVPLLNPLDLSQLLIFFAAWTWHGVFAREQALTEALAWLKPAFGVALFVWVNGVALRALHFYLGVDYRIDALLHSVAVQSTLSILWTGCALALMVAARRTASRMLWMIGAALLALVVLKLFTNDLGSSGTVARIVSFLGVGGLLLVIGYIAPVPPARDGDGKPAA